MRLANLALILGIATAVALGGCTVEKKEKDKSSKSWKKDKKDKKHKKGKKHKRGKFQRDEDKVEDVKLGEKPVTPPPGAIAKLAGAEDTACDKAAKLMNKEAGATQLVFCPASCTQGTVWGTDLYTADSAVCAALIHAGVLQKEGGNALVTFVEGLRAYRGTERNGIKSSSYGKWGKTFYGQAVDAEGKPKGDKPALPGKDEAWIDCTHAANVFEVKEGESNVAECPASCPAASVWGTKSYTADSNLCTAAVHAGAIEQAKGGKVKVTFVKGMKAYKGSEKNGVKTNDYGPYPSGGFKVEKFDPAAAPAPAKDAMEAEPMK